MPATDWGRREVVNRVAPPGLSFISSRIKALIGDRDLPTWMRSLPERMSPSESGQQRQIGKARVGEPRVWCRRAFSGSSSSGPRAFGLSGRAPTMTSRRRQRKLQRGIVEPQEAGVTVGRIVSWRRRVAQWCHNACQFPAVTWSTGEASKDVHRPT